MTVFVGVDGGGTGCRALVCDSLGNALGHSTAGPANIVSDFNNARDSIVTAVNHALTAAGLDHSQVQGIVLGLAGANINDHATRMQSALPYRHCHVTTDANIALQGALGNSDGTVAILGTGSVIIYRQTGSIHTIGGWGAKISDHGSGAQLGRQLLELSLLSYDNVQPDSPLTEHLLMQFNRSPQAMVEFAHSATPDRFARYAPLVFEFAARQDPVAVSMVTSAVTQLEQYLHAVPAASRQPLSLLGGLAQHYIPWLASDLTRHLIPARAGAVTGAVELAIERYADTSA